MIRHAAFASLTLLAACAPDGRARLAEVMPCSEWALPGAALNGDGCKLEANGDTLHVKFMTEGEAAGTVSADVLDRRGIVRQVILETNVLQYSAPTVQDVDGDGRGDIIIARGTGNVNTVSAIWLFSGARGVYERVGEVNGVSIERTGDGYIATPARSSASVWNIAFHGLDENGLRLIASVDAGAIPADDGSMEQTCELADAPGIGELQLTPEAAEAKFCAEPAVTGIFAP